VLSVGYPTQRHGAGVKCKPPDEFIPEGQVPNSSEARLLVRGYPRLALRHKALAAAVVCPILCASQLSPRSAIRSHLECGRLSRLLLRHYTGLLWQG
jgi:hypothetical protein